MPATHLTLMENTTATLTRSYGTAARLRHAASAYAQAKELYREAAAKTSYDIAEGVRLGGEALAMRLVGDKIMAEVNS